MIGGRRPGRVSGFGLVLLSALVLGPVAWSFHLLSFLHAKEAVYAAALAGLAGLGARRGLTPLPGLRFFSPLVLGLAVLALCSALDPALPAPARAAEKFLRTASWLLLAAWAFPWLRLAANRRRAEEALFASAGIVAFLALLQFAGAAPALFPAFPHYDQRLYSVFGNQDNLGGYLAIAMPVLLLGWLSGRHDRFWSLPLLALLAGVLVLSGARSAWLACALGCAVALCIGPLRLHKALPLASAAAAGLAAALFAHGPALFGRVLRTFSEGDEGWQARRWFWDATLAMIREEGRLSGVGLGQYPSWSNLYGGRVVAERLEENPYYNTLLIEHAHSEPLEWLAEGGLIAAACGLWFLIRLAKLPPASWPGLVALLMFALFNSPFHSAPHAMAGLLLAGIGARGRVPGAAPAQWRAALLRTTACAVSLVTALGVWAAVVVPSHLVRNAERVHLEGRGDPLPGYERAEAWPWPHGEGRYGHGIALAEAGRTEEAIFRLEQAAGAVEIGGRHLALGRLYRKIGALEASRAAYCACLARWPWNEEARQHCTGPTPPEGGS